MESFERKLHKPVTSSGAKQQMYKHKCLVVNVNSRTLTEYVGLKQMIVISIDLILLYSKFNEHYSSS